MPHMTRASGLIAVLLFATAPLAAQRLEIQGGARAAFGAAINPALGVDVDSLRPIGRGVFVRDMQLGNGDRVGEGDLVSVHYVGMLLDGTRFAASDRTPFTFRLGEGQVIPGWEDGVSGMRVGGRRQLVIPAFLAYGKEGKGRIPPDTPLIFDVTLVGRR